MDAKMLSYHNKVQDWSQMYLLAADGNVYKNSKLVTYLPPHKLQQIETWRKDVTKNIQTKSGFPRLKTPIADYLRTRASSARAIGNEQPKQKRIWSASSGKSLYRTDCLYSGTDLFSIRNHLADTAKHYSAQRQEVYSANSYSKKSIKINNKQVLGSEKENTAINATETEATRDNKELVNGLNSVGEAEEDNSDNLDIQTDDGSSSDLSSISRMEGRGTMICVNDETMIQVRSQSNRLLNVISIDDCKRTDYNTYHNARLQVERKRQMYQNNDGNKTQQDILEPLQEDPICEKTKTESENSKKLGRGTTQSSCKSVAESRNQIKGRIAQISKAIDEMVHDRKVMNNMDRNFDARIEPAGGRLIIDRGEGGATYKRLNSALKRHINNVMLHPAHRNSHFRKNGYSNGDISDSQLNLNRRDFGKLSSDRVRFFDGVEQVRKDNEPKVTTEFEEDDNLESDKRNNVASETHRDDQS